MFGFPLSADEGGDKLGEQRWEQSVRTGPGVEGSRLAAEIQLFRQRRGNWVAEGHDGQWVVIHGDEVLDFFETLGAAFEAGKVRWTPGTFLVKRVSLLDRIHVIQQVFWRREQR